MGLKIDELRSFVAVAVTGSFSEAARKIRRAQSVVSMHISHVGFLRNIMLLGVHILV